jgi:hypothetical protein
MDLAGLRLHPGVFVGSDPVATCRVLLTIGQHGEPESQRMEGGIKISILCDYIVAESRSAQRRRQNES